jgi:hypothetical protein
MTKVHELPVYRQRKIKLNKGLALQIAGGLCVIFMGIMLLITSGIMPVPALDGVLASIRRFAGGIASYFVQNGVSLFDMAQSSFPTLGIFALLFAAVAVILLVTLQRGENIKA